jgi:hypothetical protein
MYDRGDCDEGCPGTHSGTVATLAAPACSSTHQACRRRNGRWWARMVGWLELKTAPPPLISWAAAAPPLPFLPREQL